MDTNIIWQMFFLQANVTPEILGSIWGEIAKLGLAGLLLAFGARILYKEWRRKDDALSTLHKEYQSRLEQIHEGQRQDLKEGNEAIMGFEKVLDRFINTLDEIAAAVGEGKIEIINTVKKEAEELKKIICENREDTQDT
jgi:soluble cytochrome b562